jgi:hypothetical protein
VRRLASIYIEPAFVSSNYWSLSLKNRNVLVHPWPEAEGKQSAFAIAQCGKLFADFAKSAAVPVSAGIALRNFRTIPKCGVDLADPDALFRSTSELLP